VGSKIGRKEAIQEYKNRKAARGVFAMRCTATGHVWVDSSPNLDAARNGLWFFLRNGYHHDQALQAEWNTHGEQAFQYEILEKLDDDLSPLGVKDLLKEKKRRWAAQLGARTLSPA
jgi:hypothetical protein